MAKRESKKFLKPRIYVRDYFGEINFLRRLRVVYPDGKVEWNDGNHEFFELVSLAYPCWHKNTDDWLGSDSLNVKSKMTAKAAVRAMKAYDRKHGYKTIYLGEF